MLSAIWTFPLKRSKPSWVQIPTAACSSGTNHRICHQLCFGFEITIDDLNINIDDKIYVNPFSDRICFAVRNLENEAYSGSWMRDELGDYYVKRIAINIAEGPLPRSSPTSRSRYYDAFVRNPKNWLDGSTEEIIIYHFDDLQDDLPRDFEFVTQTLSRKPSRLVVDLQTSSEPWTSALLICPSSKKRTIFELRCRTRTTSSRRTKIIMENTKRDKIG